MLEQQRRRAQAVFFVQAEDGIRDIGVTGVQTCALPILSDEDSGIQYVVPEHLIFTATEGGPPPGLGFPGSLLPPPPVEIGRASCRERVQISVVAVSLKKKHSQSHLCARF